MKAYELLSDKSKWTQGYYARNERGFPTSCLDEDAQCFCTLGAVMRCHPGEDIDDPSVIMRKLYAAAGTNKIAHWNDSPERTYEEVIAVLKAADL